MTATPTNQGYAFIKTNSDGTKDVYIAVGVADNKPQDVVAMHLNRPEVDIEPGIHTVAAGSMIRTTAPVHISSGPRSNETVRIRSHRRDSGPLVRA